MESDFAELIGRVWREDVKHYKAVEMLESGTPNKYIGNPGIINGLQKTPLTVFISYGNIGGLEATKYALEKGADPNQPEFWATKTARRRSLIDEDPITGFFNFSRDCKKPKEGYTRYSYPLEIALSEGSYDICQLLLLYGAKWELVNLNRTMFWLILRSNQNIKCGKLLLEQRANPSAIVADETLIDFCKRRWTPQNFELLFGGIL